MEPKLGDHKSMDEGLLTSKKQNDDEGVEAEENGRGQDRKREMMEERERNEVGELTLHPLSCLFGVHGKQGVTSVCEYQGLFYSTGRDGCVRIFRVRPTPPEKPEEKSSGTNKGGLQLEVLRIQRACKGMEWLERVLILEPEIPVEEEEELEEECKNHYKTKTHNLTENIEVTGEDKEEGSSREEKKNREQGKRSQVCHHWLSCCPLCSLGPCKAREAVSSALWWGTSLLESLAIPQRVLARIWRSGLHQTGGRPGFAAPWRDTKLCWEGW